MDILTSNLNQDKAEAHPKQPSKVNLVSTHNCIENFLNTSGEHLKEAQLFKKLRKTIVKHRQARKGTEISVTMYAFVSVHHSIRMEAHMKAQIRDTENMVHVSYVSYFQH